MPSFGQRLSNGAQFPERGPAERRVFPAGKVREKSGGRKERQFRRPEQSVPVPESQAHHSAVPFQVDADGFARFRGRPTEKPGISGRKNRLRQPLFGQYAGRFRRGIAENENVGARGKRAHGQRLLQGGHGKMTASGACKGRNRKGKPVTVGVCLHHGNDAGGWIVLVRQRPEKTEIPGQRMGVNRGGHPRGRAGKGHMSPHSGGAPPFACPSFAVSRLLGQLLLP